LLAAADAAGAELAAGGDHGRPSTIADS